MNKSLMTVGLLGTLFLSGCQAGNEVNEGAYGNNNTMNMSNYNEGYNTQMGNADSTATQYGFVRYQKKMASDNRIDNNDLPILNREQVASMISKMATQIPNVNDVATLVTDEEVLIAYQTDSQDRNETADQVKKTALSVVPRYYHVYVSDDVKKLDEIERYSGMNVYTDNVEYNIDDMIKQMLKSPQGKKMSTGENENGEMQGEVNEGLDEDMNK
ncbi:YhcN/YlaJ family sporulation lipoprotein [Bacillus solimangrovi]|uniref:Sporulation protein n=1 Tax=Bacillus solimangrovi TaxID=1305675 RepID=A0A1E5LIU2_9BACI|nr:YhcN/YlaJ family sporulation lipoprotein [Bacillus solimangrovi]OEH93968.1 hypothetical protein BFG57_09990 [Bacillus solimangrovi]